MGAALAIISAIISAEPGIMQMITILRNKDGSKTIITYLDAADAQTDANLKQQSDWFMSHPKGTV